MAAISSNGTGGGDWDVGASWTGGVAPVSGDVVTVLNADTITMTKAEACDSFTANAGSAMIDGGFAFNIGGTIRINGTLTSTGPWTISGTGSLKNSIKTNAFAELILSDGITVSLSGSAWTKKINIGNCTVNPATVEVIKILASANDSWTQHASSTVTALVSIYIDADNLTNTSLINTNAALSIVGDVASTNLTFTVNNNITSADLDVYGATNGFYQKLIMGNGGNIICDDLIFNNFTTKSTRLDLGTGTGHIISGNISRGSGTATDSIIDWGSGSIICAGNIDISNFGTVTRGTSTITATGAAKTITSGGFALPNVVINSSGLVSLGDVADFTSLAGTAGSFSLATFDLTLGSNWTCAPGFQFVNTGFNGSAIVVGGLMSLAGKSATVLGLDATAGWTLNVTGTAKASFADVKNCNAGAGSQVNASNSTNSGSNTNWVFLISMAVKAPSLGLGNNLYINIS